LGIQAYIIGAVILLLVTVGAGAVLTYNHAIARAQKAEAALVESEKENAKLTGQLATINELNAAKIANVKAGMLLQQQETMAADAKKARMSEEKIAATSARDAEKYTKFVHNVLPQNLDLLKCMSDLRTILDEKDPCIGTIH